jgi:hypothetical protein
MREDLSFRMYELAPQRHLPVKDELSRARNHSEQLVIAAAQWQSIDVACFPAIIYKAVTLFNSQAFSLA